MTPPFDITSHYHIYGVSWIARTRRSTSLTLVGGAEKNSVFSKILAISDKVVFADFVVTYHLAQLVGLQTVLGVRGWV